MKLNKAKRAARARALRGRAARKPAAPRRPAPTTARRPAPTTPRRPAPPGPVSTPRRPPPVGSAIIPPLAVRAAGAVPPGTAACPYKPCSSVPPVAVVYARRLVAALVAEDERVSFSAEIAASRLWPVVQALLEEDVVEEVEEEEQGVVSPGLLAPRQSPYGLGVLCFLCFRASHVLNPCSNSIA
ncbi:uncharacterized protein BDR25DRAFT_356474 [Lindgomyces ingoldianus]|uniref:Uncharacterized protein n=1 Tax=Lindgomyces ingoldianus TaxID=673940 RepID=A0ACB6QQN8_9PLEO|nr:uncharacterized protein BDR25DRAFT_356474 [Lindgomyces ingoldianus]KAF2469226.1 hypothetical protein BDR25DRAFT_356474 [Lindgomyces ingoldianus]